MTIMKLTRKANQPGSEPEGLVPAVLAREVLATAGLIPAEGHTEPIRQAVSEGHNTAALISRHCSGRIFSANSAMGAERDLAVPGAVHTLSLIHILSFYILSVLIANGVVDESLLEFSKMFPVLRIRDVDAKLAEYLKSQNEGIMSVSYTHLNEVRVQTCGRNIIPVQTKSKWELPALTG